MAYGLFQNQTANPYDQWSLIKAGREQDPLPSGDCFVPALKRVNDERGFSCQ